MREHGALPNRDQIQKPTLHGNVGDVGAPDPIGPVDREPLEKIGINSMRGMGIAGSRGLIDRLQAHQSHQPANPVTADAYALPPQLADHLATSIEGIFQKQRVDLPHQRQVFRALAFRGVVERRPADRQNLTLPAQAHGGMIAPDHRLAVPPVHRLSPLDKKSLTTVSSPILACRSLISDS